MVDIIAFALYLSLLYNTFYKKDREDTYENCRSDY